jgi:hypothetical protein
MNNKDKTEEYFYKKYLLYKNKYFQLVKKQKGGNKQIAKEIADHVNSKNIFEEVLKQDFNDVSILKVIVNGVQEKQQILKKFFEAIKEKKLYWKYLHNIIRKDINLISDFENKTYENVKSKIPTSCHTSDGQKKEIIYRLQVFI